MTYRRLFQLLLLLVVGSGCGDDEDDGLKRCRENPTVSITEFAAADSLTYSELGNTGLLYFIADSGSAELPTATSTVVANYRGFTTDGAIFDQTTPSRGPATFPLDRVIQGWTLGVPLIGEGGVIRLLIPSDLGYGANGSRQPGQTFFSICPDTDLVFDIELLEVMD